MERRDEAVLGGSLDVFIEFTMAMIRGVQILTQGVSHTDTPVKAVFQYQYIVEVLYSERSVKFEHHRIKFSSPSYRNMPSTESNTIPFRPWDMVFRSRHAVKHL